MFRESWVFLIGIIQLNAFFPLPTYAGGSVDITAGTAIPSNSDAIATNPAALAVYKDAIFDLSSHFNTGSPSLSGAITGSAGSVGYGIQAQNSTGSFSFRGAFAGEFGKSAIGMSVLTDLSAQTPTFTVGLRQELEKYSIALVVNSLMAPFRSWSFGLGIPVSPDFKVGTDLLFGGSSQTFTISSTNLAITAAFLMSEHYAFMVSNSFGIIPILSFKINLGLGMSYWIGQKVALYGLYQMNGYNYTAGLKFSL